MRLTPMDINNKEFKKVLRGYDSEEVDEFLDKIVEDYEELFKENSVLKEKITAMNEKIEHYSKIETTIQNTLLLAQNAAEQAKFSAQKESEMIIKSANDNAQRILDKAHNDVMGVNEEYDKIKQEFIKFRAKFRNFMNVQLQTFDDLEKDFVKNYSIGTPLEEDVREKAIEPVENLDLRNLDEDNYKTEDLDAIKSFFARNS